MKYPSLFMACFSAMMLEATSPTFAGQDKLFHSAFACLDRGPRSICVPGGFARDSAMTIIARDWQSAAVVKETFRNDEPESGFETITRLQAAAEPPTTGVMIAIAAPANTVHLIRPTELHDNSINQRVTRYLRQMKDMEKSGTKYNIQTRVLKFSPAIVVAEAKLTSFIETVDPRTNEKIVVGKHLDDETVPLLVGNKLIDLFADIRKPNDHPCGDIVTAFEAQGQIFLLSNAYSCESDVYSNTLVHALSSDKASLVFK